MIFRRSTTADLTEDSYRRWLRAARPELRWFLALEPEVQEALAQIGDDHRLDTALAYGTALREPKAAEAAVDMMRGGDLERLMDLAKRHEAQRGAGEAQGLSMGGLSARRERVEDDRKRRKDAGRSLMGHKPDRVREGD